MSYNEGESDIIGMGDLTLDDVRPISLTRVITNNCIICRRAGEIQHKSKPVSNWRCLVFSYTIFVGGSLWQSHYQQFAYLSDHEINAGSYSFGRDNIQPLVKRAVRAKAMGGGGVIKSAVGKF